MSTPRLSPDLDASASTAMSFAGRQALRACTALASLALVVATAVFGGWASRLPILAAVFVPACPPLSRKRHPLASRDLAMPEVLALPVIVAALCGYPSEIAGGRAVRR